MRSQGDTQTDKMAARQLLLCAMLCMAAIKVHPQDLYYIGIHVSQEGRSVTMSCPPHNESYTRREWGRLIDALTTEAYIYRQDHGGTVNATGILPDLFLNPADFSLTISSLQVEHSAVLYCRIDTGRQSLHTVTALTIYNMWVAVEYNTSITLQCPVPTTDYTTRLWQITPNYYSPIYTQNSSDIMKGSSARDDMSLDTGTFRLTIGNVRKNDTMFTCTVTTPRGTDSGIVFTAVYRVELEAKENTSVTLPCHMVAALSSQYRERYTRIWQKVNGDVLYQQYLYNGGFYERHPAARADMSLNNDTFSLTIRHVQMEDNTMFICLYLADKASYLESVKLIVYNQKSPLPVPAIVGTLTAAAVLFIIIISGCACVRRKAGVNEFIGQPERSAEPGPGPNMNAPDITRHNETDIPREDHQEYEEIPAQASGGGDREGYLEVISADEFMQLHADKYERLQIEGQYQKLQIATTGSTTMQH